MDAIKKFFGWPEASRVERDFPYDPAKYPNIGYPPGRQPSFDRFELGQQTRDLLDQALAGRKRVPARFAEQALELAAAYVAAHFQHGKVWDDPRAYLMYRRLDSIIRHPLFLSGGGSFAVRLMTALKDLRGDTPWRFEMWLNYVSGPSLGLGGRYVLVPWMDRTSIRAFARLVSEEPLWRGNKELGRVFFGSVAQALKHLASDQGFLRETLEPRIVLLAHNGRHGDHHEPWCSGSFTMEELEQLFELAKKDRKIRRLLETPIPGRHGILHEPHFC